MATPVTSIEVKDLPSQISEALRVLKEGGEVVLVQSQKPCAMLAPLLVESEKKRVPNLGLGTITMADDFDDPLPDEFWLGAS